MSAPAAGRERWRHHDRGPRGDSTPSPPTPSAGEPPRSSPAAGAVSVTPDAPQSAAHLGPVAYTSTVGSSTITPGDPVQRRAPPAAPVHSDRHRLRVQNATARGCAPVVGTTETAVNGLPMTVATDVPRCCAQAETLR